MKIAQIVSTFPPYKAGIGNVAYHLSWELAQLGNSVTVFTPARKGASKLDSSLPFEVVRLRPFLRYGNSAFLPQLIWRLHNFDIIHLHYPFFGGAEMVYLRGSITSMNLIVHYHMDVVGEGIFKRLFKFHTQYVMPRILSHANQIIVTSLNYAEQSAIQETLETHRSKYIDIPLGVNPKVFTFRMKSKELLDKYQIHNKKIILFVGGLDKAHYFKGVNYLIKAFQLIASNDDYRLMIVGSGELRKSYESLAVNFGLERKIIFAGNVSDNWLPFYYNIADVFVLPSIDRSEAFGIAILEAMASRLPVIASDLPGVRSVVIKNQTGLLFKPKQITILAKYIQYLLQNPQICNELGSNGRKRILKNYTWQIIGKTIDNVYRQFKV